MRTEGQAAMAAALSCALRHRQSRLLSTACEALIMPSYTRGPATFPKANPCSNSRAARTDSMLCTLGRALPASITNSLMNAALFLHRRPRPPDSNAWGKHNLHKSSQLIVRKDNSCTYACPVCNDSEISRHAHMT